MKFSTPSFCYIAPESYIDTIQDFSRTHLVLAHLVDESPQYAAKYAKLSTQGHFVMMDNSAYELKVPYEPTKLVELGQKCGAHAIVLPDYPFKPCAYTIKAAEQYIDVFKQAGFMTFFVPQSKVGDVEDWIFGYRWAADHPGIDIIGHSILGVPNALSNVSPTYARVVMAQILLDRGIFAHHKHNHFLGLNSGPALEIPSLLRMNVLDTIDSSGPVWCAILGHRYSTNTDSYMSVSKPTMPVNFHVKKTTSQHTLDNILHNVTLTQSLFTQPHTESKVWYAVE